MSVGRGILGWVYYGVRSTIHLDNSELVGQLMNRR
jgi:hypothetical protein